MNAINDPSRFCSKCHGSGWLEREYTREAFKNRTWGDADKDRIRCSECRGTGLRQNNLPEAPDVYFRYPNKVVLSIVKRPRYALLILGVFEFCGIRHYAANTFDIETGGMGDVIYRPCQYIDDNFKFFVEEVPDA
jgi:hypothetical protein